MKRLPEEKSALDRIALSRRLRPKSTEAELRQSDKLPPLDGGRVAVGLLPGPWAYRLARVEPYGFFILMGLMLTGVLWAVIGPIADFAANAVAMLTGL
jgi:hypothetical protein